MASLVVLPATLLETTFGFLTAREVLVSRAVCRKLRHQCAAWRRIDKALIGYAHDIDLETIMRLCVFGYVHDIDLEKRHIDPDIIGVSDIHMFSNLRRLNLTGSKLTSSNFRSLGSLDSLESLNLSNSSIASIGLACIGSLRNLRYLNLSGWKSVV